MFFPVISIFSITMMLPMIAIWPWSLGIILFSYHVGGVRVLKNIHPCSYPLVFVTCRIFEGLKAPSELAISGADPGFCEGGLNIEVDL